MEDKVLFVNFCDHSMSVMGFQSCVVNFNHELSHSQISPGFYMSFKNTVGKGEIARVISPFPTVFSTCSENFLQFLLSLKLSCANSFSLEESKIFRLGKS